MPSGPSRPQVPSIASFCWAADSEPGVFCIRSSCIRRPQLTSWLSFSRVNSCTSGAMAKFVAHFVVQLQMRCPARCLAANCRQLGHDVLQARALHVAVFSQAQCVAQMPQVRCIGHLQVPVRWDRCERYLPISSTQFFVQQAFSSEASASHLRRLYTACVAWGFD